MEKTISIKKFIIIQIILILLIFMLYLIFIFPQVRPMCLPQDPCASAFNCECDEYDICLCDYIDSNENVIGIECQLDN